MSDEKYLFIGHEARRTGAPILLLNFLRWLRHHRPEVSFDVLLIEGGPLETEYREIADTVVLSQSRTTIRKIGDKIRRLADRKAKNSLPKIDALKRRYPVVIGNTILALPLLKHFSAHGSKTVLWMHEMDSVIRHFYHENDFRVRANLVDQIIYASEAVRNTGSALGIGTPAVVAYEPQPSQSQNISADRSEIRQGIGIPPNAFVVLGCGQIGWRKGVDLFIDAAKQLVGQYDDVYFVWVGGRPDGNDKYAAEIDRKLSEVNTERIIFTGETADVQPYYQMADVFVLTSREDPFPLVCLQAADNSLPIICFADSGGIPELVGADAGKILSQIDATLLVDSIVELYNDRSKAATMGENAKRKFDGPFSIDVNAAKILAAIENTRPR